MEKRLLFNRIAGQRADVAEGNLKRSLFIKPHATNAIPPRLDYATMPAGEALNRAIRLSLDQRLCRRRAELMQHLLEARKTLFAFKDVEGGHKRIPSLLIIGLSFTHLRFE